MPQSLSSILLHLIFSTKDREPLIAPDIEPELYPYMAAIFRELGCPTLAGNGTADHVHFLFALSRTAAVCDVVEEIKKRSSKWIKTKGVAFRGFHWQAGYGAFSIGRSNVDAVRSYIAKQKEHHRRQSFQDEYRAFLAKYEIECDERYVWD
jgi:putative transposase